MIILSLASVQAKSAFRPDGYYEDVLSSGAVIAADDGTPEYVAIPQKAFDRLVEKYDPGLRKTFEFSSEGRGPGTELKKLLSRVGITASPDCSCNARARLMDENEQREPGWVEANLDTVVGWLREEATKRGLPFIDMAGRMLVKRAIKNARKATIQ